MLKMEDTMRIRLTFEDKEEILSPSQNSEGLNQCWLLLKPQQHKTITDIAAHIFHAFQLQTTCPDGILLCIDGYALPPFESSGILTISDTISVRKKRGILSLEASQGTLLEGREVGVTKPAKEGTLLLANNEFEEESGGYLRDEREYEYGVPDGKEEADKYVGEDQLVALEEGVRATSKKRKASDNLHRSQKKKQCSAAQGDATTNQVQKFGQDKVQSSHKNLQKQERYSKNKKQAKNGNHKFDSGSMEISANTKSSDECSYDETQNNEDDALDGNVGTQKISRSARRKKAKRRWLRELVKVQKQTETVVKVQKQTETVVKVQKQIETAQPKGLVIDILHVSHNLEGHVGTQKISRSARRKKAKRRWLRELVKVQKETEIVQPKGLEISKETLSKVDTSQPKQRGEQRRAKSERENRKQKPAKHDRKEDDGEPKGLLYWKLSSAKDKFDDKRKNGEADQNGNTHKQANQHSNTEQEVVPVVPRPEQIQVNQHSDTDDEVAPVVIRPGHIRFEPSDKDQDAEQSNKSREHFIQWNGITNKKKGQKWGMEKHVYSNRKDHHETLELDAEVLTTQDQTKKVDTEVLTTQDQQKKMGAEVLTAQDQNNKDGTEVLSAHNEMHLVNNIDFDKLPSLCNLPKAGDVIGYRLLELSSSWTPEISPFRVGQVSWCSSETGKLLLMPITEYPISSLKSVEDESDPQPNESLYNEDGSLEIDFSDLVDVRMLKGGSGAALASGVPMDNAASNDRQSDVSTPKNGELHPGEVKNGSSTGNGVDPWEQFMEALNAKKAELSQDSGSAYTEATTSSKNSWSYRTLKGSALGPTMALLRSGKKL